MKLKYIRAKAHVRKAVNTLDGWIENQVKRAINLIRNPYLERKSRKLEQAWVDSRFLLGVPTKSFDFPANVLDRVVGNDLNAPSITELQEDIRAAVGKMKGTPSDHKKTIADYNKLQKRGQRQ